MRKTRLLVTRAIRDSRPTVFGINSEEDLTEEKSAAIPLMSALRGA
jgi:hypothetical protein